MTATFTHTPGITLNFTPSGLSPGCLCRYDYYEWSDDRIVCSGNIVYGDICVYLGLVQRTYGLWEAQVMPIYVLRRPGMPPGPTERNAKWGQLEDICVVDPARLTPLGIMEILGHMLHVWSRMAQLLSIAVSERKTTHDGQG